MCEDSLEISLDCRSESNADCGLKWLTLTSCAFGVWEAWADAGSEEGRAQLLVLGSVSSHMTYMTHEDTSSVSPLHERTNLTAGVSFS